MSGLKQMQEMSAGGGYYVSRTTDGRLCLTGGGKSSFAMDRHIFLDEYGQEINKKKNISRRRDIILAKGTP